mgnify:CR=1 FL=1
MTIIAFDVGKLELVGVRADKNGVAKERFTILNQPPDITGFLQNLKLAYPDALIGSEATAEYHRELAMQSMELGFTFKLLNPILTKQFTRHTIRKKKTDRTDAEIIARLLAQGEGTILDSASLSVFKSLNRQASAVNQLKKTLIAQTRHLRLICAQSGAAVDVNLESITQSLEDAVLDLRRQVSAGLDQKLKTLLCTIPGVGHTLSCNFITEIGNIHRFKNSKALIAYAGLDPKVKQSGIGLKHNTKLTKRGSPHLRQSAYIAAYIAKRCDPELKQYFTKKLKEGKRYKEAVVATARKILYRVYAVWKRGTPYVKYPQKT